MKGLKRHTKDSLKLISQGVKLAQIGLNLETRPQFSFKTDYDELSKTIDEIAQKNHRFKKKANCRGKNSRRKK